MELFERVLLQKRYDSKKIYSLHEPDVACISKGKEHKKYEFGNKVSITVTQTTGVITGALSFSSNPYDGHTLPDVLDQYQKLTGLRAKEATADRGYRGKKEIDGTKINIPKSTNVLLAAAAMNFKRMMNIWKGSFFSFFQQLVFIFKLFFAPTNLECRNIKMSF